MGKHVAESEVNDGKTILHTHDLWSELRERGRKLRVNLEEAEEGGEGL